MQRYSVSILLIGAIMSAFWGYTIIDALIRKFSRDITYIDSGAIFVLGLISGLFLGWALAFRRKQSDAR